MTVESAQIALDSLLTVEGLLFVFIGTVFGLLIGVLPGLGGAVALAILVPLTFPLDPMLAFIVLSGALGGVAFGGSITGILLNIPGTAANAATIIDGHPLAKQGKAKHAIGASAVSSALGAVVGLLLILLLLPFLRQILVLFGPPEFLAMTFWGLAVLAVSVRGSFLNGLISGSIGFILSFVGFNPVTGGSRFTFSTTYLYDGVQPIVVIIGIFAISEMAYLLTKKTSISPQIDDMNDSVVSGMKEVTNNISLFFRSALAGVVTGLVPAAGGTVATFVSYAQALTLAKDNDSFGEGDIRGVIAPEAANDAAYAGALIPTVSFGIPGSAPMVVLLGAFVLHGMQPGVELMTDNLSIVLVIIFSLLISNVLTSVLGVIFSEQLVKVTLVPIAILAPIVLIISLIGAYAIRLSILDVFMAGAFGVVGLLMIKYDLSRVALVIGLVLGPIAESSFHQSLQISRGDYSYFLQQPVALVIVGLLVITILYPFIRGYRS